MKIGGDYMRLIDAEDLWKTWYKEHNIEPGESGAMFVGYNEVPKFIDRARTIIEYHDPITEVIVRGERFEKVVRCKDCIYYQDNNNGYPHNECRWRSDETPDATDFCSYGERKDND